MESNGLSGHLHCIVLLTESGGRQMAESCLLSDAVIEDLDVLRDLAFGLLAGGEATVMHQFGIQGTPATFHRCVVPAVSLATHGDLHAENIMGIHEELERLVKLHQAGALSDEEQGSYGRRRVTGQGSQ